MKFIHLAYENIGGQTKNIDFTNKTAGVIAVTDTPVPLLTKVLSLALYGAMGDYNGITFPASLALKFELEDSKYSIIRLFGQDKEGAAQENAVLSDAAETQIIAEGAANIAGFFADKLSITKKAFDALFMLDRDAIANALTSDTATRESFIASAINSATTLDEINAKVNVIKSAEKDLCKHIESIQPVTRKAVKEQQALVSADKVEADNLKNDIAILHSAIAKAAEYQEDITKYDLESNNLSKLSSKKADYEKRASSNANCRQAMLIKDIFTEYQSQQDKIVSLKAGLAARLTERKQISDKITEGNISAKNLEVKFIYHNEKIAELESQVRKLIADAAQNPDALKIDNLLDNYYSSVVQQIQDLEAAQKALDADCQALQAECAALEARKADIRNTAAYKKTVEDAAVAESKVAYLSKERTAIGALIQKHEKEQVALYEQNSAQIEKVRALQNKYKALDEAILDGKATHKDAQDSIILYSQAIYAKHIIASGYEAEIKAVEKKLQRLLETNENYQTKRDTLAKRKKEVEAHIERLEAKSALQQDKLTEYIGYNRLKEYSDATEYGSHCPICDGFVTLKKDLPTKDISLIKEQIEIVNAEIARDRQSVDEAANLIQQYDTNLAISEQYAKSLQETKARKQEAIDAILADYGVTSLAELYQKTRKAAEDYKQFIINLNDLHDVDAELRRQKEANISIANSYNKLSQEIIPAAKEKAAVLDKELRELMGEYEKMQAILNDEKACDLLIKLQIIEKEYEITESELMQKQVRLADWQAKRDANQKILSEMHNRVTPLQYRGSQYSYKQVVVKTIAETLNSIFSQITQNEEQKEVAKTRLAAVRKVVERQIEQLVRLDQEITTLQAQIEASAQSSETVFRHYKQSFDALGVASIDDLKPLVLSSEELARREREVDSFNEEFIKAQNTVDNLALRISANQIYNEELAQNQAVLAELDERYQASFSRYAASNKKLSVLSAAYNELIASNRKLSALQEKLRALDELSAAITEGAVIAKDFAKIVVERAGKKVQRWTSDRYTFELSADGQISLFNNAKGKAVRASKFNKEEKMLLNIGLSIAFGGAIMDLLVADIPLATAVSIDETDKSSLSVLLEASKEKDLFVVPQDETLFCKAISKLA